MKPILQIFEQIEPPPQPNNRFRVLEVMMTVDGYRTRVTDQSFPTLEGAQHYCKDSRE